MALLAGTVVILLQTSCSPSTENALTRVKFGLDWIVEGTHTPWIIAKEKGYFEEEGLDVVFERGFGSRDSIVKVGAGAYDMGYGDLYAMLNFNTRYPKKPLVAVSVYFYETPMSFVALKDSGIETPKDFEGRRLSFVPGGSTQRFWPTFAEAAGIDVEKVNLVSVDPKLHQVVLMTKEVDVITPFVVSGMPQLNKEGYGEAQLNTFTFDQLGFDFYGNGVVTTREFAEENPEVVRGFNRALIRGHMDMIADPEEALDYLEAHRDFVDREMERYRIELGIKSFIITEESKRVGLGQIDPERFQRSLAQVAPVLELDTIPSVEDVFDGQYLPPFEERLFAPAVLEKYGK
jgi:NitT/TauT family transport system substrate-binding protein